MKSQDSVLKTQDDKANGTQAQHLTTVGLSINWATVSLSARAWVYCTLGNPMDCSPSGSSVHGILQTKNTAVANHFLLQGIFLSQGSNWSLLH